MLSCVCVVTDHRRRQNVVRAEQWHETIGWCITDVLSVFWRLLYRLLSRRMATYAISLFYVIKKTVMPSFMGLSSKWSRTQSKCECNSIYYIKSVLEKGVICNTVVSYVNSVNMWMASLFLHAGTLWTIGSPNWRYKKWSNKIIKFWVAWLETRKRDRDK